MYFLSNVSRVTARSANAIGASPPMERQSGAEIGGGPPSAKQASCATAWPVLALLLLLFLLIECFIPLATTVQVGADEGFELAKATLCLNDHHLYTEVWNDQPPLHTFLVTSALKYISHSIIVPRLVTTCFSLLLLSALFLAVQGVTGRLVGALTTAALIFSPGFIELGSSCMLEIPAVAVAVTGLLLVFTGPPGRSTVRNLIAGVVFGLALQIKLIAGFYMLLVPLIWGARLLEPELRTRRIRSLLVSVSTLGVATIATFVVTDLVIERGAFLLHLNQSWTSHFGKALSDEYGSAKDHPFDWSLLLKNWDITVPALIGLGTVLRAPGRAFTMLPVAWLILASTVFGVHKPWWEYYYIHTVIPLCWCGALGMASLLRVAKRTPWVVIPIAAFGLCMVSWAGARVFLQVSDLRHSPQIYRAPVIEQMKSFRPFAKYLYADRIIYSFHSGIPMVPTLAVLPLKRFWSGEMTNLRLTNELQRYKPGLILLLNDGREVPFKDLLQAEYQVVYIDKDHRLYAHRSIARAPRLRAPHF